MPDVADRRSHLWNKKYFLSYATIIYCFSCRVTSKLSGIGLSNQSWGKLKHLISNKSSHLIAESFDIQAVIYTTVKCKETKVNCCEKDVSGTRKLDKVAY